MFPEQQNNPIIPEDIKCPNATVWIVSQTEQIFIEFILQGDFNDKIEFFEVVFLRVIICSRHKCEENKISTVVLSQVFHYSAQK